MTKRSRRRDKRAALVGGAVLAAAALLAFTGSGSAASDAMPSNSTPPSISGTAQEGHVLNADHGDWTNSPTGYGYQWQRCNSGGSGCSDISGATSDQYTLGSADVGNRVRVGVTATNADGTSGFAYTAPTGVIAAAGTAPTNTSLPTISGTAQDNQTLIATAGTWTGNAPITYAYQWQRCDANGNSCQGIGGATAPTYKATSADVGHRLRVVVTGRNAYGAGTATSAATSPVTAAAPAGCPSGTGPVNVANIGPPARLLIDAQQASPSIVHRGTNQLIVRYHVSACGGRPVQGALVYATAIPYNQLSIPPELQTNSSGWAELGFRMLTGFPVSSRQQLIAIFTRARKPGDNVLGGISTRRLFSVRVNLHN